MRAHGGLRLGLFGILAWAALVGCGDDAPSDAGVTDGGFGDAEPGDVGAGDAGTDAGADDAGRPSGWWKDDVFYEVFVRSFQDSDGDGVGDFVGLASRLDYLEDLGVDGVWLMPIQPAASYHGYDVTDYRAVNPEYGSMDDFESFLSEAHARNINVLLDLVINHTSSQHIWFQQAGTGPDAMYRDFYSWRSDDPGWIAPPGLGPDLWHPLGGEYYYGIFWSGMPDLNHANEAVYQEVLEICRFWLDKGVDGFPMDAVRYLFENESGEVSDLPETHAYIKRLRADLEAEYPDVLLLAEAFTTTPKIAPYYGDGDEFHMAFSFGVSQGIQDSSRDGHARRLRTAIQEADREYSDRDFEAPFITNHDINRLIRARQVDERAFALAAATLFALPGTPFVYYGEEIGMAGGLTEQDQDKRTPFRWTADAPNHGFTTGAPWWPSNEAAGVDVASQSDDQDSLLSLFKALIAHRKGDDVWNLGSSALVSAEGEGDGVIGLAREHAGGRRLFVGNYSDDASPNFTVGVQGDPTVTFASTSSITATSSGTVVLIEGLGPRGFAYIEL